MIEKSVSLGKDALFDVDINTLLPDVLDETNADDKQLYVKVNCKSKEEVCEIVRVFEKMKIEKKRVVISA